MAPPALAPRSVEAQRFVPLDLRFQPMFFLAAAFAAGVALGRALPPRPLLWGISAVGVWLLSFRARRSRTFVPLLLVGYGLAGTLHLQLAETRSQRLQTLYDRGLIAAGEPARVIGRLAAPPERAPERVYLDLEVEHVVAFGRVHCTGGRLRLMVAIPDAEARAAYERLGLRYGRRLQALARFAPRKRYQNPGSPEYDEYLEQRGYELAAVSKSPRLLEPLDETALLPKGISHALPCARSANPEFLRRLGRRLLAPLYDAKEMLEHDIDRVFSEAGPRTTGLVKALLLGNRHFLDARMAEALRAGGTFHLLVISGLHIGILAAVLLGITSWYTRWPLGRALGTLLPLWGYALLVGGQPPVWRATVMVTVFLLASLLFRQAPAANNLGIAALVLLLVNPRQLFSPSFQLSFAAAGSLALLVAPLIVRLHAIGAWRPTPEHPYPPQAPEILRRWTECLFWNEREFQREQETSSIRFRLEKAPLARTLNHFRLQPLVRALALSLLVSSVVQLAMLPLMIEYFHRVALIGIVLNVIVGVTIPLLGAVAVSALALSLWKAHLAASLTTLARWLTDVTIASSELALRFPALSFRIPDYSGAGAFVYVAYWAAALYVAHRLHAWRPLDPPPPAAHTLPPLVAQHRERTQRVRRWALGVALLLLTVNFGLLIAHPFQPARPKGWLQLHFLDVGHGDAALLELPDGTTMLIDAGGEIGATPTWTSGDEEPEFVEDRPPIGEAVTSNFLWSRRLKRVDLLVPTHAHADHLRGFLEIVRNFDIGCVLLVRRPWHDPLFAAFLQEVQRRHIPVVEIRQGDHLQLGRTMPLPVTATVLWPPPSDRQPETWGNEDSLVLRIQYGDVTILLTGDIERAAEETLLASSWELQSDVLKVPHHGSRTSSSDAFLDRVRPRWAILSAADPITGRFRYPHPDVRERYERRAIPLLHTGQQGLITLMTDGRTVRFSFFSR